MSLTPIGRYLVALLPPFLARGGDGSDQALWMGTIGELFQTAKGMISGGRRLLFSQTSTGAALDLLGDARRWVRLPAQSDDYYRWFVTRAFELWQEGGTIPGMVRAMNLLGLATAQVYEHRTRCRYHAGEDTYDGTQTFSVPGDNWALFDIVVDEAEWSMEDWFKTRVRSVVGRMKPARSMFSRFRCAGALTYDGSFDADGTALHDGQTRFWS